MRICMLDKIKRMDERILDGIKRIHSKANNRIMAGITTLGTGGLVWFAMTIPMIATAKMRVAGLNILLSLFITWLVGEITIKRIVGRVRPSEQIPDEEQIIKRPKYYSFPSGHTASSFSVVAVTIYWCGPAIYIPVFVLATLIGFSRLYLRVHYFSDVAVGCLLGIICGFSSVGIFNLLAQYLA